MGIAKNKKFKISQDNQKLSINFSWYQPSLIITFPIVILISLYVVNVFNWMFLKIYLIAVSLVLTYIFLCFIFNKTTIEVSEQHLKINHSPIPWWKGNKNIPAHAIEQIFVKENKRHTKNGTTYHYHLDTKLIDGSTKKLLGSMIVKKEEALELEQLIEKYLGIENVPVEGEYGSSNQTKDKD